MATTAEPRSEPRVRRSDGADAETVGSGLLAALAQRDFSDLGAAFATGVRGRALLPPGLIEVDGRAAVVERLRAWFGTASNLTLLDGTAQSFADVLHVSYRLRLSEHPFRSGSGPHLIEQQMFCRVERGRIAAFDLLCSGFQPEAGE